MSSSKFLKGLRMKLPFRAFLETVIFFSYYHLITEYFFDVAICDGISMEPTLSSKDIVLIQKRDKYSVNRGDIIVFKTPSNPNRYYCKRVIRLPGDIVSSPAFSGKIPKGSIWVEGDNYFRSSDSRIYGPIPKGLILGKALYLVWPRVKDLRI